jgi:hypothetical protein
MILRRNARSFCVQPACASQSAWALRTNVTLTRASYTEFVNMHTHGGWPIAILRAISSLSQNIVDAPVRLRLNHVIYDDYDSPNFYINVTPLFSVL